MKPDLPARFGPYEILGPLGSGGMGEVYRARDTRLHREVAIKILPESAAGHPDRQRRFAQEAIAVSALNHPNIVAVYDVGVEGETPYLVSELVDGASLREDVARGRVPLRKALDVSTQIADGLAAAHGAGIVHRDLKPENVMLNREGRVKILDFGLAKMVARDDTAVSAATMTQTAQGLIVGTVPYMSPEQARGSDVDFRSDQFSLGVMVSEMLTGVHPFKRETAVQTLSAIIGDEPTDLAASASPPPLVLRWVVERLLAKDPRDRYAHTADLVADLRLMRDRFSEAALSVAPPSRAPARRRLLPWAVAAAAALAAFVLGGSLEAPRSDPGRHRFTPLATDAGYQGAPAFSPDGKSIAYVAEVDGILQVFTRTLASSGRSQLTFGRFDCTDPFWSPDGAHVYYHSLARDADALWRISLAGGAPEKLFDRTIHAAIAPDGRTLALIMGEPASDYRSLWFSTPPGAPPVKFGQAPFDDTRLDDGQLRFSPDSSTLLVWVQREETTGQGGDARTGFWSIAMPDGKPQPALSSLAGPRARALFSWMPDSRHLVVERRDGGNPGAHLWLADMRAGTLQPLTVTNTNEGSPSASPDGRQIAMTSESADFDLVTIASDGSPIRQALSSTRNELDPAHSPVRAEYAYVTDRTGPTEIWLRSEDGSVDRPLVTDADFEGARTIAFGALAFSPDGRRLAYQRYSADGYHIWISTVAGGRPVRLTKSTRYEDAPSWSPGGDWIVISTDTTTHSSGLLKVRVGTDETVALEPAVQMFARPRWSPDRQWILCQTPDGLMLIAADGKEPRLVSAAQWLAYEWSADGATVVGLQPTDDLHHFMLVSADLRAGRERVLNASLGTIPQANQPIRGFSRTAGGAYLSSIARVRSDIWLLEGFQPPGGLWARFRALWDRSSSPGR